MSISENIKQLRALFGITQKELAEVAGVTENAVSKWENGYSEPRMGAIEKIAACYGIKKSNLIEDNGLDNIDPVTKKPKLEKNSTLVFVSVPYYGSIAAGTPIEMLPIDDTKPAPAEIRKRYPDSFFLLVRGESMNRVLPNGCYALVNPTSEVENGKPYAVCVDGQAATIKRVRKLAHGFELMPDSTDPTYRPQTFDYNEPGTDTVTVIGEIVYYMLPYNWKF